MRVYVLGGSWCLAMLKLLLLVTASQDYTICWAKCMEIVLGMREEIHQYMTFGNKVITNEFLFLLSPEQRFSSFHSKTHCTHKTQSFITHPVLSQAYTVNENFEMISF